MDVADRRPDRPAPQRQPRATALSVAVADPRERRRHGLHLRRGRNLAAASDVEGRRERRLARPRLRARRRSRIPQPETLRNRDVGETVMTTTTIFLLLALQQ